MLNRTANQVVFNQAMICRTDLRKAELPILLILSIFLDGISVIVMLRIRSNNNPVHHFLITTLAANDFITTSLFTVMWIGNVSACGKFGGEIVCSVLGWLATTMVIWSAWVVVIMCAVRYLSVVKPFFYKVTVTLTKLKVILLITLILTFLNLLFPLTGLVQPYKLYSENFICAYDFAPGAGSLLHRVFLGELAVIGLLTICVVLFFNGSTLYALRRRQIVISTESEVSSQIREKRNSMANLQTKIVAGVYCLCYGPFLIRILCDVITNKADQEGTEHSVTMSLLFFSPLLNPFVYVACNKHFRIYVSNGFKMLLVKLHIRKGPNVNEISVNSVSGSGMENLQSIH